MWKETIGNENSPIVRKEWNKKLEYWKSVIDALDGIYNDHTPLDESDSSSNDFWPKTRQNVNVDGNVVVLDGKLHYESLHTLDFTHRATI